MTLKNYPFLFLLCTIFFCCANDKFNEQTDNADAQIILTIGKVGISKYELIKNFNNFKSNGMRDNRRPPSESEIRQWEAKFINRTTILADAYDKGYDSDPHIDSMVNGAAVFMISQPHGLLEQALTGIDISTANQSLNNDPLMGEKLSNQQKTLNDYYQKVTEQAKISVNDTVMTSFYSLIINYNYGPNHTFLKKDFRDILTAIIMTYSSPQNKYIDVTVADFIDFYNTLFIKQAVKDKSVIENYLISIPKSVYAYNEAEKLGITKQTKFLLDKQNFKNQLIYNKYAEDFLEHKGSVSDADLNHEYNLLKNQLIQATDVIVTISYFSDRGSAALAVAKLKQGVTADNVKLTGVIDTKHHVKVNYKNKVLPDTLIKTMFAMRTGDISRPISTGDVTILIKKEEETGKRILSLQETKAFVEQKIKAEKLAKNTTDKAEELKLRYEIINNIDPSFYKQNTFN